MATRRNPNEERLTQTGGMGRSGQSGQGSETQGSSGMTEQIGHKAKGGSERVRSGVANRIDSATDRIDQRARQMEMEGGIKRQAGRAMHKASETLESGADYVRSHGIASMRDDLTNQIRSHPYLSVGAALGTGFLLGRVFGGGGEEEEESREPHYGRRRFREEEEGVFGTARRQVGRAMLSGLSGYLANQVRGKMSGQRNR